MMGIALEREIFRPELVRLELRVIPEQLARVDAERRIEDARGLPSRAVLFRELVDEALGARRALRPKSSGPGRGEPFYIDLSDLR